MIQNRQAAGATAQLRRAGGRGQGNRGVLVKGLRGRDDRRSGRRHGGGRPSLYAVFGDKRTLFLRVLKTYAEKKGAAAAKALLSPAQVRDSLAGFLRFTVDSTTGEGCPTGCLLVCVAPLVDDPVVRQLLQSTTFRAQAMLERRFRDAISAGELAPDFPAVARASQVIDLVNGLTVRAKMGESRKQLLKDAEEAADLGHAYGMSNSRIFTPEPDEPMSDSFMWKTPVLRVRSLPLRTVTTKGTCAAIEHSSQ